MRKPVSGINFLFNVISFILISLLHILLVSHMLSVVVLEESPCSRGFSRTNLQVLVLVLEPQLLVRPSPRPRGSARRKTASSLILRGHF